MFPLTPIFALSGHRPRLAFEVFRPACSIGNLTSAARELNLTPPAATKRLAQLETRLGVRLVNRSTRHVSLTAEDETYLHYANRILEEIHEMENVVVSSHAVPKGLLRINASPGFGRTSIAPIVSDFVKTYPQVEVQLDLTDRPIDLVETLAAPRNEMAASGIRQLNA